MCHLAEGVRKCAACDRVQQSAPECEVDCEIDAATITFGREVPVIVQMPENALRLFNIYSVCSLVRRDPAGVTFAIGAKAHQHLGHRDRFGSLRFAREQTHARYPG